MDPLAADKEELAVFGIGSDITLYTGKGCDECAYTGYYGRSGIFELLMVDDEIRKLILKSADANQLREMARGSAA